MDFYLHQCKHCGSDCTGVFCPQCKTAEGRRELDANNKAINPSYICKPCDLDWYSPFSKSFSDGIIERLK